MGNGRSGYDGLEYSVADGDVFYRRMGGIAEMNDLVFMGMRVVVVPVGTVVAIDKDGQPMVVTDDTVVIGPDRGLRVSQATCDKLRAGSQK